MAPVATNAKLEQEMQKGTFYHMISMKHKVECPFH